jgi:hypothetical protein
VVTLYVTISVNLLNLNSLATKTTGNNPLVQFEPGGGPLNINLNLQQSSTYFGRSFIEFNFRKEEKQYFKAELYSPSKHETQNRGIALEAEAGVMGYKTTWCCNHFGALEFYLIPSTQMAIKPRLYLIESYRRSFYFIPHRAGRTLKPLPC